MAITDYTTYDEIRAILGVAPEELEDVTIALPTYGFMLSEGLLDLVETLEDDYATVSAIVPATKNTTRFVNLINAWAGYQVAGQLMVSIEMFAPQTIKSDKDEQTRVADPYKGLQEAITATLADLRARILKLYPLVLPGVIVPDAVAEVLMVNVGLATDPVTG